MPELPEVETIASDMRPHLEGRRILRARVLRPDILRRIRRPAFERGLARRLVQKVGRRAKHLVILLDDGARLVIQPRMTGGMTLSTGRDRDPYRCLELELDDGTRVAYRDVRRLGAVFLLTPEAWRRYDAAIGPEPLEPGFTPRQLEGILAPVAGRY
jgi:formamidopyrimidine-DNA glycosylase